MFLNDERIKAFIAAGEIEIPNQSVIGVYGNMWLLIDDLRPAMGCDVVARTAQAGSYLLQTYAWECVIFDNDLGLDQQEGWEIMKQAFVSNKMPNKIQLVTSNVEASRNMRNQLKDNGYTSDLSGLRFKKG